MSGVEIQTYLTRGASDPDLAPHILGALGSLSEDEYNELKKQGKSYSYDDKIGKFGIELACEDDLKGKGGTRLFSEMPTELLLKALKPRVQNRVTRSTLQLIQNFRKPL